MSNPCVRCGQERITGKTWKNKAGFSIITCIQTICPDKECQKVVDEGIAEKKAKTASLKSAKEAAKLAREKLAATA